FRRVLFRSDRTVTGVQTCALPILAKAAVTAWIEKMREQKIRFTYTLTREGAADFGDVVVVYYRAETLSEFPDGHVEGRGEVSRMTHTWRRFGDAWRIIGGMSADST